MSESDAFLVNAYSDPVQLIIRGRASFQNARPVSEFFNRMISQGRRNFVVDFHDCPGMDSTFLGILAGAGIRLMDGPAPGRMRLVRLGERNRELVENLGLDQIVEMADDSDAEANPQSVEPLKDAMPPSSSENARLVLEAHENLVEVDPSNLSKFQDVIQFLRNQVEE